MGAAWRCVNYGTKLHSLDTYYLLSMTHLQLLILQDVIQVHKDIVWLVSRWSGLNSLLSCDLWSCHAESSIVVFCGVYSTLLWQVRKETDLFDHNVGCLLYWKGVTKSGFHLDLALTEVINLLYHGLHHNLLRNLHFCCHLCVINTTVITMWNQMARLVLLWYLGMRGC